MKDLNLERECGKAGRVALTDINNGADELLQKYSVPACVAYARGARTQLIKAYVFIKKNNT